MLGCLALILGMFVVFQTLSHSLVTRVRQLGLLRSLGATQGAITRIFLVDALALGVLGSGLGVLLGIGLAALLKQYNISSLGMHKAWLVFEVAGATAAGHWYLHEYNRDLQGTRSTMLSRYDDSYVKVNGEWLFQTRRYSLLYHGAPDLSGAYFRPA